MQCPQCKSRSVIIKDGQKRCQAIGCTYIQFHVITYENQNRQFEGEKGTENRFNLMGSYMQGNDKQLPKHIKNFNRAQKTIETLIHTMKLSNDLQERAQSKLLEILKIKYSQTSKSKITVKDEDIAAYCLWLACYDKKLYFKDVRIANEKGITKAQWEAMHKSLSENVRSVMFIPQINIENCIRRICTKRKINDIQLKAMLQMLENMQQRNMIDGKKNTTFAGFIFWQIMSRSSTYNGNGKHFNIEDYLSKQKKGVDAEQTGYWTQKQIDTSLEAIKKFKSDKFNNNVDKLEQLIPYFSTRKLDGS